MAVLYSGIIGHVFPFDYNIPTIGNYTVNGVGQDDCKRTR